LRAPTGRENIEKLTTEISDELYCLKDLEGMGCTTQSIPAGAGIEGEEGVSLSKNGARQSNSIVIGIHHQLGNIHCQQKGRHHPKQHQPSI
jgi:hypothetical protein